MSNSTKVAVTQIIDILGLFFAGFPEIVGSVKVGPSDFLSGSQKSNLVEESRTVSFVAISSIASPRTLRIIFVSSTVPPSSFKLTQYLSTAVKRRVASVE